MRIFHRLIAATALLLSPYAALGAELVVGPDDEFWMPSEAANYAEDGDTVIIREGRYEDCAVWRADDLTIIAEGEGAVIHGTVCQEKALWVTDGNNITVENVTFEGATAAAGNGAGIRAQGGDLTLRKTRFMNNQMGILTAKNEAATLTVTDSLFEGNGTCEGRGGCAHGIYAGLMKALIIENSRFIAQQDGHHIKSRAFTTVVRDSEIRDTEAGTSSYLIDIPVGGDVTITGNIMEKGRNTSNRGTAIAIGFESKRRGAHPTQKLLISDNRFRNRSANTTNFVANRLSAPAELVNNRLAGDTRPLKGAGEVVRRR